MAVAELAGLFYHQHFIVTDFWFYSYTKNKFCYCRFLALVRRSHVG